jgi:hypothetical protein
MESAWLKSRL